ncbi:uncharacterized protein BYT42DRAFT_550464 [Radiomyces spectabilis]|uniref:uncharacterized protein n=1 Tax=Radiomyces spectabilis TaxID=64574 RepID=UPI00221F89F5|nr:uncharacterized protein BYT42DRAFT_632294 [Radiomyces spectabilis]XP_051418018.1 uncharacterized protein BYT42DRAFT_550464 [Radiomyces spectabilis]KAI8363963.1 hypothetical protein BYT42DRAFT_632294 [Radiomyces spectabilis]KAI8363964.1 hypothetical protein BYT42DRAFT_550464 [Radiomyces spectabilis]
MVPAIIHEADFSPDNCHTSTDDGVISAPDAEPFIHDTDMLINNKDIPMNNAEAAIPFDNTATPIDDAAIPTDNADLSADVADIPAHDATIAPDTIAMPIDDDVDIADASDVLVDAPLHDSSALNDSPVPLAPPVTSSPTAPVTHRNINIDLPSACEVARGRTTSLGGDNVELKNVPVPPSQSRDASKIPPVLRSGKKRKVQPLLPPRQKRRNVIPGLYLIGRRYPRIPLAHRNCR